MLPRSALSVSQYVYYTIFLQNPHPRLFPFVLSLPLPLSFSFSHLHLLFFNVTESWQIMLTTCYTVSDFWHYTRSYIEQPRVSYLNQLVVQVGGSRPVDSTVWSSFGNNFTFSGTEVEPNSTVWYMYIQPN